MSFIHHSDGCWLKSMSGLSIRPQARHDNQRGERMRRRPLSVFALAAALSVGLAAASPFRKPDVARAFGTQATKADFTGDVIYQIITDRFNDGNASNNNPASSPGLYDSTKANWTLYWGGDWAGIQAKLSYLQGMG